MNAIYARVSTDEQAKTGYSLGDQVSQCRHKLLGLGLTDIHEYIDDGYSGEFLDRPALDRLREELRQGIIKNIIVYDPDRLSRNLTNQLLIADDIEKSGAQLMFVTGDYDCSPEGRLFFSIRGAISAFEKAKIRERTLRGKRAKARQGKIPINNNPYGFGWDAENSMYLINTDEAAIITLIYDMCLTSHWGSPQIASELSSRGILNRAGKPFSPMAIYRILTKELYCGTAYSGQITTTKTGQHTRKTAKRPKEEWISIEVPPIVTRKTWENAQQVIKQNSGISRKNAKRDYLLQGIVRCGICGRGMVASQMKDHGKTRHYYRCVTKSSPQYRQLTPRCSNRFIPVDAIEEDVWQTLIDLAQDEALLNDYLVLEQVPDRSRDIAEVLKKHEYAKKKQSDIMKWYRSNLIDSLTAETSLALLAKEVSATSEQLAKLKDSQQKIKSPLALSPAIIMDAATTEEKRKILLQYGLTVHVKRTLTTIEIWFNR